MPVKQFLQRIQHSGKEIKGKDDPAFFGEVSYANILGIKRKIDNISPNVILRCQSILFKRVKRSERNYS